MSKQNEDYQLSEFYSLAQIDKLLSSKHKQVSKEFAQQLFEMVIPSILDIEVARLYQESKKLLEESAKLAGMTDKALRKQLALVTGEEQAPTSCALCDSTKIETFLGDYHLLCFYEGHKHGQLLATVDYAEAFGKPDNINREELLKYVENATVPIWCPKRNG